MTDPEPRVTDPPARSLTQGWVAGHLPDRPARAHKGDFGRLLVVAGSTEYPGAAMLTGLGAMRAGAGVVRVAVAESVAARLAGAVPELTWMVLDEEAPGLIAPSGWRQVTTVAAGYEAAVIGPGLGRLPATQRRIRNLVAAIRVPAVIDADGLNALADGGSWWTGLRASLVLTPHPGEFARLIRADAPPGGRRRRSLACRARGGGALAPGGGAEGRQHRGGGPRRRAPALGGLLGRPGDRGLG